ncbi:MAG: cytochrome c biogenesis protein ResB [Candidatus Eisenbacteria sp.]|nr:cytochrome c biogenesis protein ResB [Candidatus Eisenbacteria bacterium]
MRVLSFFKSVKLAIALILVLAASSVIGTLFPQDLPPHRGVLEYGESGYRVLEFLGVFDLYHSGWFRLLVVLLAVNILVCSTSRLRRTYRLVMWKGGTGHGEAPAGLPLRRTREMDESPDVLLPRLGERVRRLGLRVRFEGEGTLRADRGGIGRWGPGLSHLGFLVIISGMVIGSITGFRGNLDLLEGETDNRVYLRSGEIVDLPFEIRCDSFEATFYEGTARPKEYASRLAVVEGGEERLEKRIEVNDPLKYRGYWFYQSTYGTLGPAPGEGWIDLAVQPEDVLIHLEMGERKPIEGTADEVELLRFEPDFVMDENREVTSRSEQIRNPAAQIRVYREGKPVFRQWVFGQFPDVHPRAEIAHVFSLTGYETREFTGLQVAYDPGVPVVWVGCGFLILGLFLSFTVPHRRFWARVERRGGGATLRVAAGSRGGGRFFEESIDSLLEELSKEDARS